MYVGVCMVCVCVFVCVGVRVHSSNTHSPFPLDCALGPTIGVKALGIVSLPSLPSGYMYTRVNSIQANHI